MTHGANGEIFICNEIFQLKQCALVTLHILFARCVFSLYAVDSLFDLLSALLLLPLMLQHLSAFAAT